MQTRILDQKCIVDTIENKIRQVLIRPSMYCGKDDPYYFYMLVTAYVDALALCHSGYSGGFMYGEIRRPDLSKTWEENIKDITLDVETVLDEPLQLYT